MIKRSKSFQRKNLTFVANTIRLKNIGYVTYFCNKTSPIKTKFSKKFRADNNTNLFWPGKTLPVQLHWPYLLGIYKTGNSELSTTEQTLEHIEKAVIIHVKQS